MNRSKTNCEGVYAVLARDHHNGQIIARSDKQLQHVSSDLLKHKKPEHYDNGLLWNS
jgi:hypothetical protein